MRDFVAAAALAAALLMIGCGRSRPAGDATEPPIAALAPHIAEIAYALELTDRIVAVGRYCRRAEGLDAPAVSDAMSVNAEALIASGARLVFHNSRSEFFEPVLSIDPDIRAVKLTNATLDELFASIETMGAMCGVPQRAEALVADTRARLAAVAARSDGLAPEQRPRVLYLEGIEPPATVGAGWMTSQLLELAGGRNAAADGGFEGWVTLNIEAIVQLAPDVVICHVQDEPAARQRAAAFSQRLEQLVTPQGVRIVLTADNSLTIAGPNVARSAEAFYEMIHGPRDGSEVDSAAAAPAAEAAP